MSTDHQGHEAHDHIDPVAGCAADSNMAVPPVTTHPTKGTPPLPGGGKIPTKGVPTDGSHKRK